MHSNLHNNVEAYSIDSGFASAMQGGGRVGKRQWVFNKKYPMRLATN